MAKRSVSWMLHEGLAARLTRHDTGRVAASALHKRIHAVVGSLTHRELSERLDIHVERVRRYLRDSAPNLEFVEAVCRSFGISRQWLLTGRGPMRADDVPAHALREAEAGELLEAVAEALERLLERVDRMESLVQALERRVRSVLGDVPGRTKRKSRRESGLNKPAAGRAEGLEASDGRAAGRGRSGKSRSKRPRPGPG